jgi:hypothetical protein
VDFGQNLQKSVRKSQKFAAKFAEAGKTARIEPPTPAAQCDPKNRWDLFEILWFVTKPDNVSS